MFFTVLDTQIGTSATTPAYIVTGYTNINAAWSALYTVLAAASVGTIPYHSAFMYDSDGNMIDGRVFDRRVTEA